MWKGKKKKKKGKRQTNRAILYASFFLFVSRWNPPAPFGVVVLYEFLRESSLHTYIHYTQSYLLPSPCLPGKRFLDIKTSCALHSGISTSHLPEDQHLSRISATTVHGVVFTTDGSLAFLMPGTGFSRVLLCRSVCAHDDRSKVAAAVEEPV